MKITRDFCCSVKYYCKELNLLILLFLFIILNLTFCGCDENQHSFKAQETDTNVAAFARINDGSEGKNVIDLNGAWKFKATDETEWLDAIVPGTVQQDLLRTGRLKDPYYRDNELDAQWVEKKEWEYERTFTVDEAFLKKDKIVLDCRGLDVICELYLNNTLIAKTQNMFIEYEFDVKQHLRKGSNTLRAVFRSVLEWNKKQADADPRVTWRNGGAVTTDALKGLLYYSRKEASDFGWDWGIRLLSCGIWRPIRLVAFDTGRIKELAVRQDLSNPSEALLTISADIESYRAADMRIDVKVTFEGKTIASKSFPVEQAVATGHITIPDPRLWWPNGWGAHPLYTVKADLWEGDNIVHTRQVKIGFRTIVLDQEKDERGETFGIKVNGKLIFCKGANWIPADALPNRLSEAKYMELLGSCIDANMNMVRVWGGGLYESDIFYEFCDENGLLIWHDFMFASGPYLATEPYLENVRAEIENVVLRLRHHPSIALWCGNNESEHNMSGGQNWIANNPAVTWAEFDKIFYETIPATVALYDPDRPYWPSSPHHPTDREEKTPGFESASGNVHTYEVWGGQKRFSAYSEMGKYRFVAEFGFQSLPHSETVRSFTEPEDRYFPSVILDYHNLTGRKPDQNQGNVRIATYTADMFRMPAGMMNWITVSQILQGEGMKMGCEALRRNFPKSTGVLYWQLNDNWPVISWSSIDYFGRWKALHYMAKRFFNPVLVSGVVKDGKVLVYGSNDLLQEKTCSLEWNLFRFDGTVVRKGIKEMKLPANQSLLLETLDFSDFVNEDPGLSTYRKDSYRNRANHFLSLKLMQGDSVISSNIVSFVPPKYWPLKEPGIKYTLSRQQGKTKIVLSAKHFAAFVELGVYGSYAQFSDNYFHLLPGETKTVFVTSSEISDKKTRKGFFVRSLIDTYSNFNN
jgi:beta-mannosidase